MDFASIFKVARCHYWFCVRFVTKRLRVQLLARHSCTVTLDKQYNLVLS